MKRVILLPELELHSAKEVDLSTFPGFKGMKNKILKILATSGPLTLSEISDKLKIPEQNVYYHLKTLVESGILERVEEKEKILYHLSSTLIFAKIREGESIDLSLKMRNLPPFVESGVLNFSIVVGSPDPHGKHKARARDNAFVALITAAFAPFHTWKRKLVIYDTELTSEIRHPILLLGGPITNTYFEKIERFLPVTFSGRSIVSKKRTYSDDFCGFIAVSKTPKVPAIAVAGRTIEGTYSAAIALKDFVRDLEGREIWGKYAIVEGYDLDADGHVDSYEIVETNK